MIELRPITCFATFRLFLLFLPLLFSQPADATVSLEIQFENGEIVSGSLAAIVADTNSDGFLSLTETGVTGTVLAVGSTIGEGGDDTIIALFNATSGAEWDSGAGFAETIASLDYATRGISEGMPLAIYIFPSLTTPGSLFIIGDEYVTYSSSVEGNSGGTVPFQAPADPGFYAISALTSGNGGNFDPSSPTNDEDYDEGNAGSPADDANDDVGNSRQNSTSISEGDQAGQLSAGDIDYFEFEVTEAAIFSAALNGDILADAWIFDADGNVIYSPDGGPFQFDQLLQPGTYYIALLGRQTTQPGSYSLNLASRSGIILTAASPDLAIGKSAGSLKGAGAISPSGAGQSYLASIKAGKRVRAFFSVQNTGTAAGSFSKKGPSDSKFFKVKYLSTSAGNITASMKRGGFSTTYPGSSSILYRVDLKHTKDGKSRGKSGRFKISASGGGGIDTGQLRVKVSKKK